MPAAHDAAALSAAGLALVHRGAGELVLDKPPGVASELTSDPAGRSVLERVRRAGWPDARLVHRLDRVTRGLLVVALDRAAAAAHGERIRGGAWRKLYVARVAMPAGAGELIGEHQAYVKRVGMRAELVRAGGKPARLRILDVATAPERAGEAHVLVELLTGRFHQIRVMLAGLGAPLVGDQRYGGYSGPLHLDLVALVAQLEEESAPRRLCVDLAAGGREPLAPALRERVVTWPD